MHKNKYIRCKLYPSPLKLREWVTLALPIHIVHLCSGALLAAGAQRQYFGCSFVSQQEKENKMAQSNTEVCDACGVTAEMGYVILDGDDVAEVSIFSENKTHAIAEFNEYLQLAKAVNKNVLHDLDEKIELSHNPLTVKLKFECSAEKLIFELRSRSLIKTK